MLHADAPLPKDTENDYMRLFLCNSKTESAKQELYDRLSVERFRVRACHTDTCVDAEKNNEKILHVFLNENVRVSPSWAVGRACSKLGQLKNIMSAADGLVGCGLREPKIHYAGIMDWALSLVINISLSVSLLFFLHFTSADKNTKTAFKILHVCLFFRKIHDVHSNVAKFRLRHRYVPVRFSKRLQSPANGLRFPAAKFTQKYIARRAMAFFPPTSLQCGSTKTSWQSTHVRCPNNFGKHWMCFSSSVRNPKRKGHLGMKYELEEWHCLGHVFVLLRSSLVKMQNLLETRWDQKRSWAVTCGAEDWWEEVG